MTTLPQRVDEFQDTESQSSVDAKFSDPDYTIDGSPRAQVPLSRPTTLWFNTGTLCNIACENCYIRSSPFNDRLVYISSSEVEDFLDQIVERGWPIQEIGLTGGEPFMNPDIILTMDMSLRRGYRLLVLTNAMKPMMRPRIQEGLLTLQRTFGKQLQLRISLDHYTEGRHDAVRGAGTFRVTLKGMDWLQENGFSISVAGRRLWKESEHAARLGFARLFRERSYRIDAHDAAQTVLFPEMDEFEDVPEVSEGCWSELNKRPQDMMCSSSRMVVKRKGADRPAVLACTLIPYDQRFELGRTLKDAECTVSLNHPHCTQFCVLGGASCSPGNQA
ncbi:MAG: radical SAM protein [Rhodobacteraceae bacterium]|nr:radical SAM protein [Paracoccaceae bacterium]